MLCPYWRLAVLARHPANPNRPYVPWQRKVKAQLNILLAVPNPDIRTLSDIQALQQRLQQRRQRAT